jgi:hypothetical protein
MPGSELVYAVIQPKESAPRPVVDLPGLLDYGHATNAPVRPKFPRVLFGKVAQFDESEDLVEDGYVPVRMHNGRVIAAPLSQIRPA